MDRRWYTFLLIGILGVAVFIVKRCKNYVSKPAVTQDRQDPASDVNRVI